ncbi:MAG: hypothetical protein ACOX25_00960 [Caldicoprobacterales bacterium]|nr:hypothetical protein [Clostridiales bacterium]
MIPVGAVAGLLWVYFLGNMDRYLNSWSSLFSNGIESAGLLTSMERVFLKALLITTLAFGFVYAWWAKHNEKYKKFKNEVLELLKIEPCYHKDPCSCVDNYCEWLEMEQGIDLL